MVEDISTEQKILNAAEEVFLASGYDGARMQEIANLAGINKAMLHYYFRSKDLLFERIFDEKAKYFFPEVHELLKKDIPFVEQMEVFVECYILFANKHPYIPFFIISTVNQPDKSSFIDKLPFKEIIIDKLMSNYGKSLARGEVANLDQPFQFLLSVISMCVFPFLVRPILARNFQLEDAQFSEMMSLRIRELQLYIRKILKP